MIRAFRSSIYPVLGALVVVSATGCVTLGKYNALVERVDKLEARADSGDKGLAETNTRIDKMQESLGQEVESLRARVADIGADLSDLQRTVARVQGRQEEIDFKLAEVSNKVKGIKGVVEDKFGVDVEDLPPDLPSDPVEFFKICQDAYDKGMTKKARTLYREFVNRFPKHEKADDAQFMVGECYFAETRYEEAVIAYKQVYDNFQSGDKYKEAVLRIGLSYEKANSCKKAISIYEFAAKTFKKTPEGEQAAAEAKRLKKTCKSK